MTINDRGEIILTKVEMKDLELVAIVSEINNQEVIELEEVEVYN